MLYKDVEWASSGNSDPCSAPTSHAGPSFPEWPPFKALSLHRKTTLGDTPVVAYYKIDIKFASNFYFHSRKTSKNKDTPQEEETSLGKNYL
jgi:hypothetical protein